MLRTKRKPATVGEILTEEFLHPHALTQWALADAVGVPRKLARELCNNRRTVTARILARVLGNTPDVRLNTQRRTDLWLTHNSPGERARIDRARPLTPHT